MDGLFKAIGIAVIGIAGIGIVLFILSAMCFLVALFAYATYHADPAVTISPLEGPTPTPAPHPSGGVIFDETKTIRDGYYQYYSIAMKPGMSIDISISADDLPVDLMVMDSANFSEYVAGLNGTGTEKWHDVADDNFIIKKSLRFVAPAADRYYIVVDNTPYPDGGAEADEAVDVTTVITYE